MYRTSLFSFESYIIKMLDNGKCSAEEGNNTHNVQQFYDGHILYQAKIRFSTMFLLS